mmetsp:Transcript_36487/g.88059  ORF Transcript_36487/g.88059 Transcript_36487/m.88059 type:complete len:226 (-) Transcript_36487:15122-15799(-)
MTSSVSLYPSYSTTRRSRSTSISGFPQIISLNSSPDRIEKTSIGNTFESPSTKKLSIRSCQSNSAGFIREYLSEAPLRHESKSSSFKSTSSPTSCSTIFFQTVSRGSGRSRAIPCRSAVPTSLPRNTSASSTSRAGSPLDAIRLAKDERMRFSEGDNEDECGGRQALTSDPLRENMKRSLFSPTAETLFGVGSNTPRVPKIFRPSELVFVISLKESVKISRYGPE